MSFNRTSNVYNKCIVLQFLSKYKDIKGCYFNFLIIVKNYILCKVKSFGKHVTLILKISKRI